MGSLARAAHYTAMMSALKADIKGQNEGIPNWEGSQNRGIPKYRGPKLGIPSFPETCPGTAPGLWDPFFGIPPLLGSPPDIWDPPGQIWDPLQILGSPGTGFGIPSFSRNLPLDFGIPPGRILRSLPFLMVFKPCPGVPRR